jgi:hypothetical protein
MSEARRIGLPWYRAQDYAQIRAMMADAHALASSYDAWRAAAENNEQVARTAGLDVVRVVIEPEAFAAWCAERSLPPDSGARMRFVAESARETARDPD